MTGTLHKQRKVQVQWDAEEYFHHLGKRNFGLQEPFEASMLQGFPPIELSQYLLPADAARGRVIANPFVVTDIKDHIILWFLPGVFTPSQQVSIQIMIAFGEANLIFYRMPLGRRQMA